MSVCRWYAKPISQNLHLQTVHSSTTYQTQTCHKATFWKALLQKIQGERKAHSRTCHEGPEGCTGIALYFFISAIDKGGRSKTRPGHFTPGNNPVPIVLKAGWTGTENLVLTEIRSPDRPVCSESLYRRPYPGLSLNNIGKIYFLFTLEDGTNMFSRNAGKILPLFDT